MNTFRFGTKLDTGRTGKNTEFLCSVYLHSFTVSYRVRCGEDSNSMLILSQIPGRRVRIQNSCVLRICFWSPFVTSRDTGKTSKNSEFLCLVYPSLYAARGLGFDMCWVFVDLQAIVGKLGRLN